jgi:hypothetical protein
MSRRIKLYLATFASALAVLASGSYAASANAATIPIINVSVGSSAGGVSGYYGADDGHSNWRYVETEVTASPTLENLNGAGPGELGAVGATLGNENTGADAQIGLYDNNGKYGVAYDSGTVSTSFDDPIIEAGLINSDILSAPQLLGNTTIHAGDKILVSIYYNPTSSGHGKHELQFSATDVTQTNEHRSAMVSIGTTFFTEWGIGVVSDAGDVTAALNNNLETFSMSNVTFYSSNKGSEPIIDATKYYAAGDGGLSQVQYVNTSDQPEISPNSSLATNVFTVFEGSTTS